MAGVGTVPAAAYAAAANRAPAPTGIEERLPAVLGRMPDVAVTVGATAGRTVLGVILRVLLVVLLILLLLLYSVDAVMMFVAFGPNPTCPCMGLLSVRSVTGIVMYPATPVAKEGAAV